MNGPIIDAWLKARNCSREWFADKLGVSTGTLQRYFSRRRATPRAVIIAASTITGLSEEEITSGSLEKAMVG